jgi:hypothetical protein
MDNNAPAGDQISAFVSSYFLGVLEEFAELPHLAHAISKG